MPVGRSACQRGLVSLDKELCESHIRNTIDDENYVIYGNNTNSNQLMSLWLSRFVCPFGD